MKFSQRIQNVQPSMTMSVTDLARRLKAQGEDVIGFGAGEPDFHTPENIKQAGIEAIRSNQTYYTGVSGTDELRDAIVAKFKNENGLDYERGQIVVSCGAKQSFYNLAQVLWEEGDEVLIPAPYWVSYPDIVALAGAQPVIVPTTAENEFKASPEQLQAAVTPKTRALVFSSPCNPSGAAYTRKELEGLAEFVLRNNLLAVSDEIYEHLVYDGFKHVGLAEIGPEIKKQTAVINGVSKGYAMTGWRIGYLAAEKEIAAQVSKLQGQLTSGACTISQVASVEALTGPQEAVRKMRDEFLVRRNEMVQRLNAMDGVSCYNPVGSFYTFPDVSGAYGKKFEGKTIDGSLAFTEFLLKQAKVAVVPGVAFGADRHVRISFATSMDNIKRGMDRMAEAISSLAD